MAEEKISELEDRRENSGETEMIEKMELADKVIKKWLQYAGSNVRSLCCTSKTNILCQMYLNKKYK